MLQLWDGEPHIQLVTTRQLLQMRSGIPDYDDELIREFALEHPDEDFVPLGFISGVDKHFLFPPGSGGSYSSVGFVLIGWILAAASAAPRWEALDQRGLVEANSTFALEYSTFAGRGACSQYERVVHQYMYRPGGRNLAAGRQQDDSHCTRHDQHSWFDNSHLQATPIGEQPIALGSAEACCAQADRFQGATYWEFQRGSAGGGVCTFYKGAAQLAAHWPNATAGMVDVSVSESDFIDLIDGSCLNGWTMGNLAAAPSDLTRFYHALLDEQSILSAASLQQMMAWKPLSKGFSTGTPYGLGLMRQTMQIGVQGSSCGRLPDCTCDGGQCVWRTANIGHPGADYGSTVMLVGHLPSLNLSFAVATNTGEQPMGINSTLGLFENRNLIRSIYCELFQLAVAMAIPSGAPQLACN